MPMRAATFSWRESGSIRRSGPEAASRLRRMLWRTASSSVSARSAAGA